MALTLRKVSLLDAQSLEIQAAYMMPIENFSSYVLGTGTTELTGAEEKAAWKNAREVDSYEIGPGESANVIVVLDNGAQETGTARALRIDYEQNNRQWAAESTMTLTLADEICHAG